MENNVRVGVAVYVLKYKNDDSYEYLFLKRTGKLGTNTWCAPGGKMEFGESIEECSMREFREEVGDDIVITEPMFYCITNDFFVEEQQHYITIHMISEYVKGEAKINEPNKFSDIGWFNLEEIKNMDLFYPVFNFFKNNYTTEFSLDN